MSDAVMNLNDWMASTNRKTLKELMESFDSEETLMALLESLQKVIDQIEYNGYLFRKGQVETEEAATTVMDFSKGAHTLLCKIAGLADKEDGTKEAKFILEAKNVSDGKAPTDTVCTATAKVKAQLWRRTAGLLMSYVRTLEKDISVCQTKLKKSRPDDPRSISGDEEDII